MQSGGQDKSKGPRLVCGWQPGRAGRRWGKTGPSPEAARGNRDHQGSALPWPGPHPGAAPGIEVKALSRVRLFTTPWTVAHQAAPSMGFSRQENWSGLPSPSPGDLSNPGIEPGSPALQADLFTVRATREALLGLKKKKQRLVPQSRLTLCDPTDDCQPGSFVHGIFQARILEWVAISFSRGSSQPGIEPGSPALKADSLPTEPLGKPGIKVTPYSSARNPSVVTSCPQEQAPRRTRHQFLPIILELAAREVVLLHHTDEETG